MQGFLLTFSFHWFFQCLGRTQAICIYIYINCLKNQLSLLKTLMNQIGFDQEVLECFPVLRLRGNAGGPRSRVLKNCWEGWQVLNTSMSRWWFQIFFIFIPIWGRFPI